MLVFGSNLEMVGTRKIDVLASTLGICLVLGGLAGFVILLTDQSGFDFGYHHVGLNLWSSFLVLSLLAAYVGAVVLWSSRQMH